MASQNSLGTVRYFREWGTIEQTLQVPMYACSIIRQNDIINVNPSFFFVQDISADCSINYDNLWGASLVLTVFKLQWRSKMARVVVSACQIILILEVAASKTTSKKLLFFDKNENKRPAKVFCKCIIF